LVAIFTSATVFLYFLFLAARRIVFSLRK